MGMNVRALLRTGWTTMRALRGTLVLALGCFVLAAPAAAQFWGNPFEIRRPQRPIPHRPAASAPAGHRRIQGAGAAQGGHAAHDQRPGDGRWHGRLARARARGGLCGQRRVRRHSENSRQLRLGAQRVVAHGVLRLGAGGARGAGESRSANAKRRAPASSKVRRPGSARTRRATNSSSRAARTSFAPRNGASSTPSASTT